MKHLVTNLGISTTFDPLFLALKEAKYLGKNRNIDSRKM
jgi:hypothetical protein